MIIATPAATVTMIIATIIKIIKYKKSIFTLYSKMFFCLNYCSYKKTNISHKFWL